MTTGDHKKEDHHHLCFMRDNCENIFLGEKELPGKPKTVLGLVYSGLCTECYPLNSVFNFVIVQVTEELACLILLLKSLIQ
ncbi:MAG: hypothetical protein HZR80_20990 [Candidatus Heimdallarchaeota archaeon]